VAIDALGFGRFYTALEGSGLTTSHHFGLGLPPFDRAFRLVAGTPGLLAAGADPVERRRRSGRTGTSAQPAKR
jgi:hypothetical protein